MNKITLRTLENKYLYTFTLTSGEKIKVRVMQPTNDKGKGLDLLVNGKQMNVTNLQKVLGDGYVSVEKEPA